MRLSVLDQSVAVAGRSEDASIRETVELAQYCEALGYHRFWVSEHHNHPSIVGTAPEILMAAIAARTNRIRIGSAGVMLPHYATLKVAEQFRVLDALAPGRIDLGVGRAPGSDFRTALALNPDAARAAERFPDQVQELRAMLAGRPGAGGVIARPQGATAPVVWMLGSSDYGARLAAHLGLPYAFAHFITDGRGTEEALELYRSLYRPTEAHPRPQATVCIWALTAATEDEAWHLFASRARWRIARSRGELFPLPSPEEALADDYNEVEAAEVALLRQRSVVGTPAQVAQRLRDLAARWEVEELVVLTWAHDPAARRRSYALLAQAFGLGRSGD
ncbi:MAG TPA: LLM class flavin-dependent oxidoreductase [Burkholderiaceae bacterium]|nr:LLM class flavin-dependent oxidoreductase [Burkholderiaceae bacterium]